MAELVLFHSAYGLRPAVRDAAYRLRHAGHRVETPDLYDGRVASTLEEARALHDQLGREELLGRAQAALACARPGTIIGGLSLGASLAQRVAERDRRFARLLLIHGIAEPPLVLPACWSVQVHLAEDDAWAPASEVDSWRHALEGLGALIDLHWYRAGHLFTDGGLPEYEPDAAEKVWERAERFLAG